MELRRAADALLRSQGSPLASFLAPSASPRWQAGKQLSHRQPSNRSSQRSLVSSSRRYALRPQATTSAAPERSTTSPSAPSQPSESMKELTDSLGWASRPSPRSRFSAPPSSLSPALEKTLNGGTSASDLLAALNAQRSPSSSSIDVGRMMDPNNRSGLDSDTLAGITKDISSMPKIPKIPMKLNPSTGRSVTIGTGIDVGRGIRLLEQSCARNRVKADANKQRFHERGGLKRKRLRRERWRKRFLDGFKATVGRVKQLKNQGW